MSDSDDSTAGPTPTFTGMPVELRLQIWEAAIGSSNVHRIRGNIEWHRPSKTRELIKSTATARAGLSVSRLDRAIIRRWILPNEIPLTCDCTFQCRRREGVVRYHAANDIVCISWELARNTPMEYMERAAVSSYHFTLQPTAWVHDVRKLATDCTHLPQRFKLTPKDFRHWCFARFCSYFRGLEQFYVVYRPENGRLVEEAVDEDVVDEAPRTEEAQTEETPEDDREDDQEDDSKLRALVPWCDEDKDDTGYYTGTCDDDAYLSGRVALDWLTSRRGDAALLQEIGDLHRWRAKLGKTCKFLSSKRRPTLLSRPERATLSRVSVRYLLHLEEADAQDDATMEPGCLQ